MTNRFFYRVTKKKYVKPCTNKEKNKSKVMENTSQVISSIENIIDNSDNSKKKRVKIEKKEKGLIEKTSMDELVLTEDNKMLLND